jgi:hypothetical protein
MAAAQNGKMRTEAIRACSVPAFVDSLTSQRGGLPGLAYRAVYHDRPARPAIARAAWNSVRKPVDNLWITLNLK